jgi:hypothetical protein
VQRPQLPQRDHHTHADGHQTQVCRHHLRVCMTSTRVVAVGLCTTHHARAGSARWTGAASGWAAGLLRGRLQKRYEREPPVLRPRCRPLTRLSCTPSTKLLKRHSRAARCPQDRRRKGLRPGTAPPSRVIAHAAGPAVPVRCAAARHTSHGHRPPKADHLPIALERFIYSPPRPAA